MTTFHARLLVLACASALAAQGWAAPPRFVAAPGSPIPVGKGPSGVVTADLNRDGKADLVAAVGGASVLSVLLGDGRGGLAPAPGSPLPAGRGAWSVAVADLDGDGKDDLATADVESGTVSVLLQK